MTLCNHLNRCKSIILSCAILLTACATAPKTPPSSSEVTPKVPASSATITIDEQMYDAPDFADQLCKDTGNAGAQLLESKDGKSTFQCYK